MASLHHSGFSTSRTWHEHGTNTPLLLLFFAQNPSIISECSSCQSRPTFGVFFVFRYSFFIINNNDSFFFFFFFFTSSSPQHIYPIFILLSTTSCRYPHVSTPTSPPLAWSPLAPRSILSLDLEQRALSSSC